jgi:hypothetical protein
MAVVINEFEVLSESANTARRDSAAGAKEGATPSPSLEPPDLEALLRILDACALRVWPH